VTNSELVFIYSLAEGKNYDEHQGRLYFGVASGVGTSVFGGQEFRMTQCNLTLTSNYKTPRYEYSFII